MATRGRQGEWQPLPDASDLPGQGGGQFGLVEGLGPDDPGPVEQDQGAAVALDLVVVPARVGPLEHDHVDGGELGGVAEPVEPLGVPVPGRHRHHQPGHDRGGGGQGGLDRAEGSRDVAVVHVHLEVDLRQLVGPPKASEPPSQAALTQASGSSAPCSSSMTCSRRTATSLKEGTADILSHRRSRQGGRLIQGRAGTEEE